MADALQEGTAPRTAIVTVAYAAATMLSALLLLDRLVQVDILPERLGPVWPPALVAVLWALGYGCAYARARLPSQGTRTTSRPQPTSAAALRRQGGKLALIGAVLGTAGLLAWAIAGGGVMVSLAIHSGTASAVLAAAAVVVSLGIELAFSPYLAWRRRSAISCSAGPTADAPSSPSGSMRDDAPAPRVRVRPSPVERLILELKAQQRIERHLFPHVFDPQPLDAEAGPIVLRREDLYRAPSLLRRAVTAHTEVAERRRGGAWLRVSGRDRYVVHGKRWF